MSKIVTTALLFAKALFKEKATYLFGVAAAGVMAVALGLGEINIGSRYKLFEDVLLTSQGYLLLTGALFYTFGLLTRDKSVGLFILPLSMGMKRQEYLGTLMLALFYVIGALFAVFVLIDVLFLFLIEGELYWPILAQLFLYFQGALLSAFVAVAFSQYVSLTNSLLYALILFLIGNAMDELYLYAYYINNEGFLPYAASLLYYLFPNFSFFDHQGAVVNRGDFGLLTGVLLPFVYFLIWSGIAFLGAWFRFRTKALTLGR